jgi:hypothetical protein
MALLTDLGIHRAKPKDSVYTLKDGRGLSLRIEPNGAKLWHFRFYWQDMVCPHFLVPKGVDIPCNNS